MILHFVLDEKVTNEIIENFLKVDEDALFIVFVENKRDKFRHISKQGKFLLKYTDQDDINHILASGMPHAILMHAFHLEFAKCILRIKSPITIGWYEWGFDIYGLPRIKPHTYGPETNAVILRSGKQSRLGRIVLKRDRLRRLYHTLKNKEDRYSIIFRAMEKVSFFVTYLKEDYVYFSTYYPNDFTFVYCPFSTIEQYLGGSKSTDAINSTGDLNILVGNSASPESNHLDVLVKLQEQKGLSGIKFYFPLSYGAASKHYIDEVLLKGKKTLGPAFHPMLSFLNRPAYLEILDSCSTGIFYHFRQQAMGNIIAMLYQGARIYLSSRNPAMEFFQKNGIVVFDFDKDFKKYKNSRLADDMVLNNKRNLEQLFSESRVLSEISKLNSILSTHHAI